MKNGCYQLRYHYHRDIIIENLIIYVGSLVSSIGHKAFLQKKKKKMFLLVQVEDNIWDNIV